MDGPRTDVADSTQYFYYMDAAADGSHRIGDLWQVVNAEGHVTEYLSYDAAGRVLAVQDPNGVITRFAYDARGRLTERRLVEPDGGPDAVTAFAYDAAGNLVQVTPPGGAAISYEYDAAHRLVAIEDAAGDRIEYTLDAAGNRIEEQVLTDGMLFQARTREYNTLNRLVTAINGVGDATSYTYDAEGNRKTTTDPKAQVTTHQYDALSRLTETVDALDGVTSYAYDAQDHLTAVTDPEGLTTHYSYDALDNLLQLDSPDTGVTTYTYDAAGNRTSQTDARGVTTDYTYDALGRLTAVSYPDASLDVALHYDEPNSVTGCAGSYSRGRLTRMTDASGSTTYCYDHRGNVTGKTQVIDGFSFTLGYGYDAAGRLTGVSYPWLGTLGLTYRTSHPGQVASLTWNGQPFLTGAHYAPFGSVAGWDFANGRQVTRGFDAAGRIETLGGSLNLVLDYGPAGNLEALYPPESPPDGSDSDDGSTSTPGTEPPLEQYAYDALNRLTEVQDGSGAFQHRWTYDAVGNRLSEETPVSGGGTGGDGGDQDEPTDPTSGDTQGGLVSYGYGADSHRLLDVGGTPRSYDAAGNTVQKGNLELVYNDANRLAEVREGAVTLATYTYNGQGQRVRKTANGGTTYWVYGEDGRLLFESNAAGTLNAYLWLGDLLVGVANFEGAFAIETDHLGTPRLASNLYGATAWRWPQLDNAFGDREARTIQDGDGPGLELNLRFPGQYHDQETGLHYNYFRDYEPGTGRYVESDPIGLAGGLNTYAYALANPLVLFDPDGLRAWYCDRPLGGKPGYRGAPLFNHQYLCATSPDGELRCGGQTTDGNYLSSPARPTRPDEDYYSPYSCTEVDDDYDFCVENCLFDYFDEPRPRYGVGPQGVDCQEWARDGFNECFEKCY